LAAVDPIYGYTGTDNQSDRLSGAFAGGQAGYNYQL
jgi:hypothetical protein